LAHYGTSPLETQIRGHKLYWHQGAEPDIEASASERQHESQLTRMVPLQTGVRFKFMVRFENLRDEELGALWWALALPGDPEQTYCHKLGMGKPLGMGAVKITPRLYLTDRRSHYARLFDGDRWHAAAREADAAQHLEAFEDYVLRQHGIAPDKPHLSDVERIQMLLAMLQWREGDSAWLETTRYMEIERGPQKVNEYKERPVLPDPLAVAGQPVRPPDPKRDKEPIEPSGVTRTGTVKWFNSQKAYGFIRPDGGGKDVFVHVTGLAPGVKALRDGQRVEFEMGTGPKGRPQAVNVRLVNG
jgi:cold shock CspA family protein